jgi:hypothetical protein
MTQTAIGICLTKDGLASRRELVQGDGRPEVRTAAWRTSSLDVRHSQAAHVPVTEGHDPWSEIGQVTYLERSKNGDLWCVAHLDDDVRAAVNVRVGSETRAVPVPLYWSVEWDTRMDGTDVVLRSVGLVTSTARLAAQPIQLLPGPCDHTGAERRWNLDGYPRELLRRAGAGYMERRRRAPIIVRDQAAPDLSRLDPDTPEAWQVLHDSYEATRRKLVRPVPLEYRPGYITSVIR